MHSRISPTFSSMRISVSGFMLISLTDFELDFVHGDKYGFICIFLHAYFQFDQHYLFQMPSFFQCVFLDFFKSKIRCIYVCGFTSGFSILFHCSMFLFCDNVLIFCLHFCFTITLQYILTAGMVIPLIILLLFYFSGLFQLF